MCYTYAAPFGIGKQLLVQLFTNNIFVFVGEPIVVAVVVVVVKWQLARQRPRWSRAEVFSIWVELMSVSIMNLLAFGSHAAYVARHPPSSIDRSTVEGLQQWDGIRTTLDDRMLAAIGLAVLVAVVMVILGAAAGTAQRSPMPFLWEHLLPHICAALTLGAVLLVVAEPLL